jgi:sugar (pentulose or hexulose) kinase
MAEGRLNRGFAIIVDIGKTLSKVSLWSRDGEILDRQVRPNQLCTNLGVRCLDTAGIEKWLVESLGRYASSGAQYVVPVAHGAGVAALVRNRLAFPPIDYEQAIPDEVMDAYRQERDDFAVTGSPALPDGLNIGSQLFWLEQLYPAEMAAATLLPWAQYWAWFLSGVAATEVTSLGCHSDLWSPDGSQFSPLAERMGWADRFAPLRKAADSLGALRPELAELTGLSSEIRVLAGLHDSNAALLAARGFDEIARGDSTILSTGTWFIAMRLPAEEVATGSLAEGRDCLVNIDAYGRPVPSARFMGGREIESVIEFDTRRVDIKPDQPALLAAVPNIIRSGSMLLPTLAPGFGPYPTGTGEWIARPDDWYERRAAVCLYAALVADTMLDLIGARDRLLIEGRFADADVFVRALASLRPDMAVYTANAHNDVSFGALRLIDPSLKPQGSLSRVQPLDDDISTYRSRWLAGIGEPAL